MARSKELCVVLLDVGPHMHPFLDQAARAVGNLVEGKMLAKPTHEVGLVFFGTTGTSNAVAEEMAAAAAAEGRELELEDRYDHITTQHGLAPLDTAYLASLAHVPRGQGASDFMEAIVVGSALLVGRARSEAGLAAAANRLVLLTNFGGRLDPSKAPPDEEELAASLSGNGVRLEVVDVACPPPAPPAAGAAAADGGGGGKAPMQADGCGTEEAAAARRANLDLLDRLLQNLEHEARPIAAAPLLAGAWPSGAAGADASTHTYFSGPLELGAGYAIKVKLAKKTTQEKFPTLAQEPAREAEPEDEGEEEEEEGAEGGGGGRAAPAPRAIIRSTIYFLPDDPEKKEIAPEERQRGVRYGSESVFMPKEMEDLSRFPSQKGLRLVGFIKEDLVPRAHYMKDVWCAVADKDAPASRAALAALVAALHRRHEVAIVRFLARAGFTPHLYAASPVLPVLGRNVAALFMAPLPFMEDERRWLFASFRKPDRIPTGAQEAAAAALVDAMWLGEGRGEELAPERTVNPSLNRFFFEMGRRAVDRNAAVGEDPDPLLDYVLKPHLSPAADAALEAAAAALPLGELARDSRRGVVRRVRVDPEHTLPDFIAMVANGDVYSALKGLVGVMDKALETSTNGYDERVVELAKAMREACIAQRRSGDFNRWLKERATTWGASQFRRAMWERLDRGGIMPIHSGEHGGSPYTEETARDFMALHRGRG